MFDVHFFTISRFCIAPRVIGMQQCLELIRVAPVAGYLDAASAKKRSNPAMSRSSSVTNCWAALTIPFVPILAPFPFRVWAERVAALGSSRQMVSRILRVDVNYPIHCV